MPNANSHTHCQAALANAKTKAWQRVCLPHHTTKTTDKPTTEKEQRRHNITYTQAGVSCFVGQESGIFEIQFLVGSSVVKMPCLRIAENRYLQP